MTASSIGTCSDLGSCFYSIQISSPLQRNLDIHKVSLRVPQHPKTFNRIFKGQVKSLFIYMLFLGGSAGLIIGLNDHFPVANLLCQDKEQKICIMI